MIHDFFSLGKKTAKETLQLLYFVGFIPLLLIAFLFGKVISSVFLIESSVPTGNGWYTGAMTPNYSLGGFVGIVSFVTMAVIWKLLCELLLLVFNSLEVYIRKNN